MLKNIIIKDISKLCNIQDITENGIIKIKDKEIIIYKVEPANIISYNEQAKIKLYYAYLTCIRTLPSAFQIVVSKEQHNLKEQIRQYTDRMLKVENYGLKVALKKYIEYLENIQTSELYNMKHYLVIENINSDSKNEISNVFSNMEEFGITITLLNTKEKVEKVLKNIMLERY